LKNSKSEYWKEFFFNPNIMEKESQKLNKYFQHGKGTLSIVVALGFRYQIITSKVRRGRCRKDQDVNSIKEHTAHTTTKLF